MKTSDLLQNIRLIVRDEMAPFIERIDARFDHVYTLFDGVFGKFDRLESELVALKGGLARVEARLTDVEARLTDVEARLTNVESRLSSVESELEFVKAELARYERWRSALEARFDASEQNAARDSKIAEINEQLVTLNGRVAALETRH